MNLYLVSQDVNNDYDTYDSFVCVADNEGDARKIHPASSDYQVVGGNWCYRTELGDLQIYSNLEWCLCEDVDVQLIGIADSKYTEEQVILASFNAG